MVESVAQVNVKDRSVTVGSVNISSIADLNFHYYYHYSGSLTTPGCDEGVKWFISSDVSYITEEQVCITKKSFLRSEPTWQMRVDSFFLSWRCFGEFAARATTTLCRTTSGRLSRSERGEYSG